MFYVFNTTQQWLLSDFRLMCGNPGGSWGTGELQTQLHTSARDRVQGHAVTDCGKVVSDNRCRTVTRTLNGVIHDRADGPRAVYFGLELGAKTIRRQISQQYSSCPGNAYFVESHDVGLSLRSLNLLSICCVGPERQKTVQNIPQTSQERTMIL